MRQRRIPLHWERVDLFHQSAVRKRVLHTFIVGLRSHIEDNVFLHGSREDLEVLEYRTDRVTIGFDIVVANVHTVREDLSFATVVKSHQELYERRFTGSVISDQSDLFTGLYLKVDIGKYRRCILLVGEADPLEGECFCRRSRDRVAFGNDLRLVGQKVSDLLDVKARLARLRVSLRKDSKVSLQVTETVDKHDHRRQRKRLLKDRPYHEVTGVEHIADKVAEEIVLEKRQAELLLRHGFFRFVDFVVCLLETLLEHIRDLRIETDLLGVILQIEHALDVIALSFRRIAEHSDLKGKLVVHLVREVTQDKGRQHEEDRELISDQEVSAR